MRGELNCHHHRVNNPTKNKLHSSPQAVPGVKLLEGDRFAPFGAVLDQQRVEDIVNCMQQEPAHSSPVFNLR
jgi:hypothetical protein